MEHDLERVKGSRARFESQRIDPRYIFAESGYSRPEKPGKIHTLDCHVVRATIESAERLLGDPLATWNHGVSLYPSLLTREEAEAPGRKRCVHCAPDVREVKRQPRMRLSGLGWPSADGSCARSPRPDWMAKRGTT
jgi:hypothetical protein